MGFVECPVYVLHSKDDEKIEFDNGKRIYEASPQNFDPYFPEKGGHNDIKIINHDEFYKRMKKFAQHCFDLKTKLGGKEKYIRKFRGRLMNDVPHFYVEENPVKFDAKFPSISYFNHFFRGGLAK